MAWTFVSADSGGDAEGGGNSTVTVTPASIQDDDLIVLFACADTTMSITFPAGFTAPAGLEITTSDGRLRAAYRVASSESGGYKVDAGGSFDFVVGAMVFRGGDPADVFDVSTERTTSGTAHVADSVTTSADDALLVAIYGSDHGGGTTVTWTTPSGMTERVDQAIGSWASVSGHHVNQATAGASGDKTATASTSSAGQSFLISFNVLGILREQEGARWRDDDDNEADATWLATQDLNITRAKALNTRVRILKNTTLDTPSEQDKIQERKVGDPDSEWRDIS